MQEKPIVGLFFLDKNGAKLMRFFGELFTKKKND